MILCRNVNKIISKFQTSIYDCQLFFAYKLTNDIVLIKKNKDSFWLVKKILELSLEFEEIVQNFSQQSELKLSVVSSLKGRKI